MYCTHCKYHTTLLKLSRSIQYIYIKFIEEKILVVSTGPSKSFSVRYFFKVKLIILKSFIIYRQKYLDLKKGTPGSN
jgi:hypothetical protein